MWLIGEFLTDLAGFESRDRLGLFRFLSICSRRASHSILLNDMRHFIPLFFPASQYTSVLVFQYPSILVSEHPRSRLETYHQFLEQLRKRETNPNNSPGMAQIRFILKNDRTQGLQDCIQVCQQHNYTAIWTNMASFSCPSAAFKTFCLCGFVPFSTYV